MKKSNPRFWSVTFFLAVCMTAFCQGYVFAWTCTGTSSQCQTYQTAIQVASGALTADRIYDQLTPVVSENPSLVWKDGVIGGKVLVAAYKAGTTQNPPFSTCQPGVVFPKDCTVTGSPWVTIVPELYNFFQTYNFSTIRIEQLLGLPPNYGNTYIVEYWADLKDLFRPAMDPQIVYQEGTVKFPWDASPFLAVANNPDYLVWDDYCMYSSDPACTCTAGAQYQNYQCWFKNRREWVYSYSVPDHPDSAPYPWTGLGYTFDWGNKSTPVGLSEFVLNKAPKYGNQFTVTIQSVTLATDYFKKKQKVKMTVAKNGLGKGWIVSTPSAISCGPSCTTTAFNFNKYADVTLTATAKTGSVFIGWSGACTGSALTCTIPMVSNLTVNAHFALGQ